MGDLPARLRVEALQRVDAKPLRRRQGTPLACLPKLRRRHGGLFFSTRPNRIRRFAAIDQHPVLNMQTERSGQDQQFKITALANEVFHRIPMTDTNHVLPDEGVLTVLP